MPERDESGQHGDAGARFVDLVGKLRSVEDGEHDTEGDGGDGERSRPPRQQTQRQPGRDRQCANDRRRRFDIEPEQRLLLALFARFGVLGLGRPGVASSCTSPSTSPS